MVGLGVASFGHVSGVHMQNLDKFDDYCASVNAGRPAARPRACVPTPTNG